jgi:hypothetical protein
VTLSGSVGRLLLRRSLVYEPSTLPALSEVVAHQRSDDGQHDRRLEACNRDKLQCHPVHTLQNLVGVDILSGSISDEKTSVFGNSRTADRR